MANHPDVVRVGCDTVVALHADPRLRRRHRDLIGRVTALRAISGRPEDTLQMLKALSVRGPPEWMFAGPAMTPTAAAMAGAGRVRTGSRKRGRASGSRREREQQTQEAWVACVTAMLSSVFDASYIPRSPRGHQVARRPSSDDVDRNGNDMSPFRDPRTLTAYVAQQAWLLDQLVFGTPSATENGVSNGDSGSRGRFPLTPVAVDALLFLLANLVYYDHRVAVRAVRGVYDAEGDNGGDNAGSMLPPPDEEAKVAGPSESASLSCLIMGELADDAPSSEGGGGEHQAPPASLVRTAIAWALQQQQQPQQQQQQQEQPRSPQTLEAVCALLWNAMTLATGPIRGKIVKFLCRSNKGKLLCTILRLACSPEQSTEAAVSPVCRQTAVNILVLSVQSASQRVAAAFAPNTAMAAGLALDALSLADPVAQMAGNVVLCTMLSAMCQEALKDGDTPVASAAPATNGATNTKFMVSGTSSTKGSGGARKGLSLARFLCCRGKIGLLVGMTWHRWRVCRDIAWANLGSLLLLEPSFPRACAEQGALPVLAAHLRRHAEAVRQQAQRDRGDGSSSPPPPPPHHASQAGAVPLSLEHADMVWHIVDDAAGSCDDLLQTVQFSATPALQRNVWGALCVLSLYSSNVASKFMTSDAMRQLLQQRQQAARLGALSTMYLAPSLMNTILDESPAFVKQLSSKLGSLSADEWGSTTLPPSVFGARMKCISLGVVRVLSPKFASTLAAAQQLGTDENEARGDSLPVATDTRHSAHSRRSESAAPAPALQGDYYFWEELLSHMAAMAHALHDMDSTGSRTAAAALDTKPRRRKSRRRKSSSSSSRSSFSMLATGPTNMFAVFHRAIASRASLGLDFLLEALRVTAPSGQDVPALFAGYVAAAADELFYQTKHRDRESGNPAAATAGGAAGRVHSTAGFRLPPATESVPTQTLLTVTHCASRCGAPFFATLGLMAVLVALAGEDTDPTLSAADDVVRELLLPWTQSDCRSQVHAEERRIGPAETLREAAQKSMQDRRIQNTLTICAVGLAQSCAVDNDETER